MKSIRIWLGVLTTIISCDSSQAALTFSQTAGVTSTFVNGKYRVSIVRTPLALEPYIIEGDAADTIEWIRVTNNSTTGKEIRLFVSSADGTDGLLNVEEITRTGQGPVTVYQLETVGNLGRSGSGESANTITVDRLQGVVVSGNLYAPILMRGHPSIPTILSDVRIQGNAFASIQNDQGPIGSIDVSGDIVGPSTSALTFRSIVGIESLRARSITNAGIGQFNQFSYLPVIDLLEVTNDFTGSTSQGLVGLFAQAVGTVRIGGNFGGFLRVEGGLPNNPNLPNIQIGGSLLPGGTISLPASGLKSQVIINGNAASGAWEGAVSVGGTVLAPLTTYGDLPASIGGGAVGRTPFNLHRQASFPADNAVLDPLSTPSTASPILMRHYGPVEIQSGQGTPFTVTRRNPLIPSQYTDETDCFDVMEVDSANHTIVRVVPNAGYQFVRGYEYVVQRRRYDSGGTMENVLRCDLPSGASPQVFDYEPLTFTICGAAETVDAAAPGDANSDGCVNFADVTSVLTNFGFGPEICGKLGDADRNGTVEFADITAVLVSFGLVFCASCEQGGSSVVFGNDGPYTPESVGESTALATAMELLDALRVMGYQSIDSFVGAISQMDEESRNAEVRRLGGLLEASE